MKENNSETKNYISMRTILRSVGVSSNFNKESMMKKLDIKNLINTYNNCNVSSRKNINNIALIEDNSTKIIRKSDNTSKVISNKNLNYDNKQKDLSHSNQRIKLKIYKNENTSVNKNMHSKALSSSNYVDNLDKKVDTVLQQKEKDKMHFCKVISKDKGMFDKTLISQEKNSNIDIFDYNNTNTSNNNLNITKLTVQTSKSHKTSQTKTSLQSNAKDLSNAFKLYNKGDKKQLDQLYFFQRNKFHLKKLLGESHKISEDYKRYSNEIFLSFKEVQTNQELINLNKSYKLFINVSSNLYLAILILIIIL